MKSYCLKCRKDIENKKPKVLGTSNVKQWYYQNVQYAVINNQELLKTKTRKGC